MTGPDPAVSLDRVVAVVVPLPGGREQTATGYLVDGRRVLTAEHCTRDRLACASTQLIRISRATGGEVSVLPEDVTSSSRLDLAVVCLPDDTPWEAELPVTRFGRIDRGRTGVVTDCTAIGYPLFQWDPTKHTRHHAELHGTIYQTDEAESGRLLLRERFTPGRILPGDFSAESPWGGCSGALVFHGGRAIGVVVEHHPRQGANAVQLCGFDRLIEHCATDDAACRVAQLLGLTTDTELPIATSAQVQPVSKLVDLLTEDGDLPTVAALDPYRLGSTNSAFGTSDTYRQHDPYVARTFNNVDSRLHAALDGQRMVLVVGASKAGKTRTSYEAVLSRWPDARLLTPRPGTFEPLVDHPRLQTGSDDIVVWLDDVERYLADTHPLTPNLVRQLNSRPGRTVVIATLRTEVYDRLTTDTGDLTRDTRLLLDQVCRIELWPTTDSAEEQAAAARAYPNQDLHFGLGAVLAGAPDLLRRYDAAKHDDPLQHAVIGVAVDWARVGRRDPIPENVLNTLARQRVRTTHAYLDVTEQGAETAVRAARTPPQATGRVAALSTYTLRDDTRGYRPFDYLVAADEGQDHPPRPIPEVFWRAALEGANADVAVTIGIGAFTRGDTDTGIDAFRQAASAGDTDAMTTLGLLLESRGDLAEAETWHRKSAEAGNSDGIFNLAKLLRERGRLKDAEFWYVKAADGGNANAMFNLGNLLKQSGRVDEAQAWYRKAAAGGNPAAMSSVGDFLRNSGEPGEAEGWYRQAIDAVTAKLHPANPDFEPRPEMQQWHREAATTAMFKLAFELKSRGNTAEAEEWYRRAAADGHLDAMTNLGNLLKAKGDTADAEEWYRQAANSGHPNGMHCLAVHLREQGNVDEATAWYRRAADAGHLSSMHNLANLLSGYSTFYVDEAEAWYRKAATAGHTDAMVNLGNQLRLRASQALRDDGRGKCRKNYLRDVNEAESWYRRAAQGGSMQAMINLSAMGKS